MNWTLVTGGAKGLGAEICKALASEKKNVLIHYRKSRKEAEKVAEECRKKGVEAAIVYGDFDRSAEVLYFIETIRKEYPQIESLVNNVGEIVLGSGLETPFEMWEFLFQTNFHAPNGLIQGFLPSIKEQKGAIVNIGSAGSCNGRGKMKFTAYSLTKNALYELTRCYAKELAPVGVRVNMVSPGEMSGSVTLKDPSDLPMGRAADPAEVARTVVYLLSKESAYITGQNIEVAGGLAL